jgi:hypothetical protein
MINMRHIKEDAFIKSMCRKMAPPLGTSVPCLEVSSFYSPFIISYTTF